MQLKHCALVVDDKKDVCEEIGEALRSVGQACVCAGTQEEAESALESRRFCYVLLDLELPVNRKSVRARMETGFNLLARIRQRFSKDELPVVVMTAYGKEHYHCLRAMKLEATDYMKKPFADEGPESLEAKVREAARACEAAHEVCPNISPESEGPAQDQEGRSAAPGAEPAVAVHVHKDYRGAVFGKVDSMVVNIGSDDEAPAAVSSGAAASAPTSENHARNGNEVEHVRTRVEALERRFASRLDLNQFGMLEIRDVVTLAGEPFNDAARKRWKRKCEACAVPGRGPRGRALYDPWKVAHVLQDEGTIPQWGALAVQRCPEVVASARKLEAESKADLDGLLCRWLEGYGVPKSFVGARKTDLDDIKAQIALFVTERLAQGQGKLTHQEFEGVVARAEVQALEWWKQEIMRPRGRENVRSVHDDEGRDITGRLDGFQDPTAEDPVDAAMRNEGEDVDPD